MQSTAKAGVFTLLSRDRKKAGPRNPIDCIICGNEDVKKSHSLMLKHHK